MLIELNNSKNWEVAIMEMVMYLYLALIEISLSMNDDNLHIFELNVKVETLKKYMNLNFLILLTMDY